MLDKRSYRDSKFADKTRPISSVNAAAGMRESRAANRALLREEGERVTRVSTAQRRLARVVKLDERGKAVPPALAPGASYPSELKPFFADLMLTLVQLAYVALLIDGEVVHQVCVCPRRAPWLGP